MAGLRGISAANILDPNVSFRRDAFQSAYLVKRLGRNAHFNTEVV
jgi:hypothetical protein